MNVSSWNPMLLPLHLMRILAYILSFYILLSAVVPCSLFDNCESEDHTEQGSGSFPVNGCNHCSPFSTCAAGHGFTINLVNISFELLKGNTSLSYGEYCFSAKPGYLFLYFQPPRQIWFTHMRLELLITSF